jgi:DNA repair protein RecO (recombination protein O)
MTHKTRALVLRTVRYGETSVIVTAFTELFGVQAYLINGVRTAKQGGKLSYYQPGALLDLVVYHAPQKNLQRIRDGQWSILLPDLFGHVIKNCVVLFQAELLLKCLKQPEPHPDLFVFCVDFLTQLHTADATETANMPLYFSLQLANLMGFQLDAAEFEQGMHLDIWEGCFTFNMPKHPHVTDATEAAAFAAILQARTLADLGAVSLQQSMRHRLLHWMTVFYALHVPDFGELKTLPVLQAIMRG